MFLVFLVVPRSKISSKSWGQMTDRQILIETGFTVDLRVKRRKSVRCHMSTNSIFEFSMREQVGTWMISLISGLNVRISW